MSLFDVIMDVIPKPEVISRPVQRAAPQLPPVPANMPIQSQGYQQIQTPQVPQFGFPQTSQGHMAGSNAIQMYDMSTEQARQSQHFG